MNKCQCYYCLDIIESKNRHDFVVCKCGAISTDGGSNYIKRGWGLPQNNDFVVEASRVKLDQYPIIDCKDPDFPLSFSR